MDSQENIRQARDTLLKLNTAIGSDSLLRERFIEGEYNWLQFYQALIFLDLREHYAAQAEKRQGKEKKKKQNWFLFFALLIFLGAFLISFLALLRLIIFRTKVLVFSTDKANSKCKGDFRLGAVYQYLKGNGIPFVEVFFTTLSPTFGGNLKKRQRIAFYLQSVEGLASMFSRFGFLRGALQEPLKQAGFSGFDEGIYIRELILKYDQRITRSLFVIHILTFVLRLTNVKVLFTIDSVRRYNEVVASCKKAGIQVIAFQHGQFTKYQMGWLAASDRLDNVVRPDKLIVWSEYWKRELLHFTTYFREDELIIGGKPHEGKEGVVVKKKEKKTNTEILIPFEMGVPKEKVSVYIQRIAACPNISVLFKTRPDRDKDEQLQAYGINGALVEVVEDMGEAIQRADVVAGAQSTLLYEMVEAKKPVLILDIGFDYTARMVENGLAERVLRDEDICARLKAAIHTPESELKKRQQLLTGKEAIPIEKTLSSLLKTP